MKNIIRKNMFETNSSSINVIVFENNSFINNKYNLSNVNIIAYEISQKSLDGNGIIKIEPIILKAMEDYLIDIGVKITDLKSRYITLLNDVKYTNDKYYSAYISAITVYMIDHLMSNKIIPEVSIDEIIETYVESNFNYNDFYKFISKSILFNALIYILSKAERVERFFDWEDTEDYINIDEEDGLSYLGYLNYLMIYEYATKKYIKGNFLVNKPIFSFMNDMENIKIGDVFDDAIFNFIKPENINDYNDLINQFTNIDKYILLSKI